MNDEPITVSICCLVYNQKKFLRQCLDGFVMQKTSFKFEVLIHDDASTDGSTDIIREYEKKYPSIIKPIYQKHNQFSQGKSITWTYLFPRVNGEYVALCEGDDYWTDCDKLEKQYKILESNREVVFCTHKVKCVNEDGVRNGEYYPKFLLDSGVVSSEQLLKWILVENIYPFQTSCYFFRKLVIDRYLTNLPEFIKVSKTGSVNLMLLCATVGNVYYIEHDMSAYRQNSAGSWSARQKNKLDRIDHLENMIATRKEIDRFFRYKFTDSISQQILDYEFNILLLKHDNKKCLEKKYLSLFNQLGKKERVYIRLFGHFPKLEHLYRRIRGKNK